MRTFIRWLWRANCACTLKTKPFRSVARVTRESKKAGKSDFKMLAALKSSGIAGREVWTGRATHSGRTFLLEYIISLPRSCESTKVEVGFLISPSGCLADESFSSLTNCHIVQSKCVCVVSPGQKWTTRVPTTCASPRYGVIQWLAVLYPSVLEERSKYP